MKSNQTWKAIPCHKNNKARCLREIKAKLNTKLRKNLRSIQKIPPSMSISKKHQMKSFISLVNLKSMSQTQFLRQVKYSGLQF